MSTNKYPELRCKGFKKETCEGMVVIKSKCLCQACYQRERYSTLKPNIKEKERERKRKWHVWNKDYGRNTKQRKRLSIAEKESNRVFYSLGHKSKETITYTIQQFYEWHKAQSKICKYCRSRANHLDHIIPLSKGGGNNLDNLQLICGRCNRAKWDSTEEEFLSWLKTLRQ